LVIVSARIIWYPAVPGFHVGKAGQPKHAVTLGYERMLLDRSAFPDRKSNKAVSSAS
jgi:hypothetical protein